ncbi:hypothetical protein I3843_12G084300 [Carya illinoinensis]|nr:hypothetical protein I3843_12G084300 [Carya illinoinensis]
MGTPETSREPSPECPTRQNLHQSFHRSAPMITLRILHQLSRTVRIMDLDPDPRSLREKFTSLVDDVKGAVDDVMELEGIVGLHEALYVQRVVLMIDNGDAHDHLLRFQYRADVVQSRSPAHRAHRTSPMGREHIPNADLMRPPGLVRSVQFIEGELVLSWRNPEGEERNGSCEVDFFFFASTDNVL